MLPKSPQKQQMEQLGHLDPSQDSSPMNRKPCISGHNYLNIICKQARKLLTNSECL